MRLFQHRARQRYCTRFSDCEAETGCGDRAGSVGRELVRRPLALIGALALCIGVGLRSHAAIDAPYTNRLIDSNNPYLLLHAHNPVDWYPWGTEALEKARRENKPIFLSVGYSTCYWCHVAERTLFANP